jgi:hypothetical protein
VNPTASSEEYEPDQQERDAAILKRACLSVVGNNFDAVQVIATRYDGETGTVIIAEGLGNLYARIGAVDQWRAALKRNAP